MSHKRITIEHVRRTVLKPFDEFQAAFEAQLGQFDPAVEELLQLRKPETAVAKLESLAGTSGFMIFRTSDHGSLLRIVGQEQKALQYLLGNPLFALEMTRHVLSAALYAPLRVLIYETEQGQTTIEYDLPSSLFGQFENEHVDRVAKSLDQKLADLIETATAV